jgi:molybdopterin/thiamine biosynthesis adenylyltransferase
LACCRLGFKKIIIVDKDKVEAHNLNRQVLFSKSDIGRQKVVAAAESLKLHDIHTGSHGQTKYCQPCVVDKHLTPNVDYPR